MSSSTPLWTDQHDSTTPEEQVDPASLESAYFEHVSEADVAELDPGTRRALVTTHVELAAAKGRREAVVRVTPAGPHALVQVVQDDMPYLVDSVTAELTRLGHAIQLVAHPTFITHRDEETGRLLSVHRVLAQNGTASGDTTAALSSLGSLVSGDGARAEVESWIGIQTLGPMTDEQAAELEEGLAVVLADVRAAVADSDRMRSAAFTAARTLAHDAPATVNGVRQSTELLNWMEDGHFTFMGYREYLLRSGDNGQVLVPVEDTGLGVLRERPSAPPSPLSLAGRNQIEQPIPLIITKANSRSRVQRAAYLDYVAVKTYARDGRVVGERRFIGLWDPSVYTVSVADIPLVRDKVAAVLALSGFPQDSHSGAELEQILETYPRDELFQVGVEELWDTCRQILQLQERRRTRLFLRPDTYGRFINALIYLPRDRYNTTVRGRIQDVLLEALGGESLDFQVRLTESVLARLYFRIRLPRELERAAPVDAQELERRLVQAVRSWKEGVDEKAVEAFGQDGGVDTARLWDEAFPQAYRVAYEVDDALEDIGRFTGLPGDGTPGVHVVPPVADERSREAGELVGGRTVGRMKVYSDRPRTLTEVLPVLQNLGLSVIDERPFEVEPTDGRKFYLYDFGLGYPEGTDPRESARLLEDAVVAAATGATESDAMDRLVLAQGLDHRTVAMLRAYAKYLRQLGLPYTLTFMADSLLAHPEVSRALVDYFYARFDPALPAATDDDGATAGPARRREAERLRELVEEAIDAVPTLDAERVLQGVLTVMQATQRTSFFQDHRRISFKVATEEVPFAPRPRPAREIWVYAPDVEGVHLRFGPVARGGLRWSDRREDFRTEVLGLVKAQQVKNAVIVPSGAKGGFYAKRLPDPAADRGAWMAAGQEAYRTFIRGLLDLTDRQERTAEGARFSVREDIVRYDGDDAYLVVAADKGTASFSDTANEISAEYGHWLGDAFASGGSVGYDHKAMGITARGAWESVKSHFASIGVDTQSEDFTVVGIGDMSGDVFGNGMLLSEHVRLVAAFNHLHVFLDPDPDAAASFAERRRLFELPRSSWSDYDRSLISEGGGVFDRSAKSVPVSEPVRRRLGLPEGTAELTPAELIRAILQAPVDLLYNGGIGTYVKASDEDHAEVGDRANNAIRVNGAELRTRVVAEGGNLGLTQRGRIEASLKGVLLNTDAIDNSAGVDCSDHEVNIKILVDQLVAAGALDAPERPALLESMTEDVARLVLRTNVEQNTLLRNDSQKVAEWLPSFARHLRWLEANADLDRDLESLPDDAELERREREGASLTTPELAVMSAYAKIHLSAALLDSSLPDDPWFESTLEQYFPEALRERFADQVRLHPLRREIIATMVANDVVNTGGTTFVFRAMEETGAEPAAVVHAYVAIKEIFAFGPFLDRIASLPASVPGEAKARVYLDARRVLDRSVRWFINHRTRAASGVGDGVAYFRDHVQALAAELPEILRGQDEERYRQWRDEALEQGLPEDLASRRAYQFESYGLLDVVHLARQTGRDPRAVADVYYRLYDRFDVDPVLNRITGLPRDGRWRALARAALRDDLYGLLVSFTDDVLSGEADEDGEAGGAGEAGGTDALVERWTQERAGSLRRAEQFLAEVQEGGTDDLASLSVALRQLRAVTAH
ncbi:NAD-glutamate dehydrogenase [Citricoccus sp. SGAir0253]|uniref:NAD-glutamate dehydrogenase n=1 Tax=Citricoccus sp. SGAir0253 TaxID=2567881 RepID=UPI0010CD47C5|nr:NAD-glutamate dehydrogenase [Citricoccus sp. SGAir0253]QCU77758.1 NAD-glutamate dehydrogenase [Citricoccus sp. SGAir0253]